MNDAATFEPAEAAHPDNDADRGTVRTTIDIAASPERVFAALIDPQELAAWWGSTDTYRTHDWRVDARPDGEWDARTTDPSGKEGSIHGKFIVVDRPSVLESTWHASEDGLDTTTVRYDLVPAIVHDAPGTRLTVTHTGFNGFVACAGMDAASCATALCTIIDTLAHSTHTRRVLVYAA